MRLPELRLDPANVGRANALIAGVGGLYVAVTGWAMFNISFDVWGAFVAAPVIVALMVPLIRRLFRDHPSIAPYAYLGLGAKFAGTLARYWVTFDAYAGAADSQGYHDAGRIYAGQIRNGDIGPWSFVPHGTGTDFMRHLTGSVYTLVGASKLAGFLWFSMFGFIGVLLCVKAATIAAPTFALERYALFCAVSPSLMFWPSSIGKEAWMSLCLGVVTYGAARIFVGRAIVRSLLWVAAGATGAAFVRPHIAAIWVAAGAVAAVWNAAGSRVGRRGGRGAALLVVVVGLAGLVVVGRMALQFLDVDQSESLTQQVTSAFDEVAGRTSQGGSSFTPPDISSPADYPMAVLLTVTRPLPQDVTGMSSAIPALETAAIVVIALAGLARWRSLPGLLARSAFTVYHLLIVVMGALAYSSFSNLAILVRQRSLLMPSLLLLLCMPVYRRPAPAAHPALSGTAARPRVPA